MFGKPSECCWRDLVVWEATKSFGIDMTELNGNNDTSLSFSNSNRDDTLEVAEQTAVDDSVRPKSHSPHAGQSDAVRREHTTGKNKSNFGLPYPSSSSGLKSEHTRPQKEGVFGSSFLRLTEPVETGKDTAPMVKGVFGSSHFMSSGPSWINGIIAKKYTYAF